MGGRGRQRGVRLAVAATQGVGFDDGSHQGTANGSDGGFGGCWNGTGNWRSFDHNVKQRIFLRLVRLYPLKYHLINADKSIRSLQKKNIIVSNLRESSMIA